MMLSIKNDQECFNVRVAGVAQKGQKILLLNEPLVGTYWFLPGGRAEMHESTDETVAKELEEEMYVRPTVGTLLWIIENFFTLSQKPYHTIGFYYSVAIPQDHPLFLQEEYVTERHEEGVLKQFRFRWCSLEEISSMDIRPPCLKKMLPEVQKTHPLRHLIVREPDSR